MKILFATPECAPFVKTGGLGDVSAALPAALADLGHDVRILLPAYRGMKVSGEAGDSIDLPAEGPWPAAQLLPLRLERGVTLLLLACPDFYQRAGGPYVDAGGQDYSDNALRFGFLSHVAARLGTESTPCSGWQADIVHANDWPCAMAPLYLARSRELAPAAPTAASVMTIHNLAFQGVFPMAQADILEVPWHWRGMEQGVEFWGQLSMLKAGVQFADRITTVSPSYAGEIQTPEFGVGLDGLLRSRSSRLTGILNGIDDRVWNPATDPLLPHAYSATDLSGKARNKDALQKRCGLAPDPQAMLFGVVSRLTPQKGIDWVLQHLDLILSRGGQLSVLGQGEPRLQEALLLAAAKHPKAVSVTVDFDESLAHWIEAGSDCFLMPSRFEPCGLNQMYSQAYGTPPLVNATGGLVDSVVDASVPSGGTGFVMHSPDSAGYAEALGRAQALWAQPELWRQLQVNGMLRPFGWASSASAYVHLYESALKELRP